MTAFLGSAVEAPYTLSDMAADGIGLLDCLGIESAHVVGASMGGMIAQTMAIEHPDRVRTLTSVMSTTGEPDVRHARPGRASPRWCRSWRPAETRGDRVAAARRAAARLIGSPDGVRRSAMCSGKVELLVDRVLRPRRGRPPDAGHPRVGPPRPTDLRRADRSRRWCSTATRDPLVDVSTEVAAPPSSCPGPSCGSSRGWATTCRPRYWDRIAAGRRLTSWRHGRPADLLESAPRPETRRARARPPGPPARRPNNDEEHDMGPLARSQDHRDRRASARGPSPP